MIELIRKAEITPVALVCVLVAGYNSRVKGVFGQSKAVELLARAVNDQRRHHAWIFSGPRGVGKCTAAIKFAELLLGCEFQSSASCYDLHVIRKEDVVWSQNPSLQRRKQTNIPLDLLRERMIGGKTSDGKRHDSIAFKTPVSGKEKVFIIDDAELLDEAGQNALLKTLEEPPPGTTILLVTCREDLLLPTIRSRCQSLPFSPLDELSMQQWAATQEFDCNPADLAWALKFSCGSPGLVCEAVDTNLPALHNSISRFMSRIDGEEYTSVSTKIIEFVENNVAMWIKENPNTSKEAANRRATNLVLSVFGLSARYLVRGSRPDVGIAAAAVLVDVERQLSTNISIKVLLESLTARWAHLSAGDAVFM